MTPLARLATVALAAVALTPAAPAQSVAVAGVNGQYGWFDLATRQYTQISSSSFTGTSFAGGATGLAYDTTTGTLYVNAFNGGSGTANTELRTVAIATGATTLVGTYNYSGSPGDTIGLAVNSSGQMFNYNYFRDSLFSIDKATAVGTGIGGAGSSGIAADRTTPFYTGKLAFVGTTLYGTMAANNGAANGLYSFNLTSGAATPLGNGGAASTYTNMIAFGSGSTLYGINGTTLYQISTADGALTNLGAITGANVPTQFVAAVVAPIPEPATVLGVAAAGLGLARLVRRRRSGSVPSPLGGEG